MLSEFDRETMERTLVQAGDETFDHLPCKQFKTAELLYLGYVPI